MTTPRVERPDMADYGVTDNPEGLLPWSWAEERLVGTRNFWFVTANSVGRPRAIPVWGVWMPDRQRWGAGFASSARKVRNMWDVTPHRAFGMIETPEKFSSAATRWVWT